MVNVDLCSRYAEEGLCFHTRENAEKIALLHDLERNVIFRGKTASEIEKMLRKFSQTIKQAVTRRYGFDCQEILPASNNNRDHADLYVDLPDSRGQLTIEVKFGSYTDKAAGMSNIARIFGTTIFTDALSVGVRKVWIGCISIEYPDMSKHQRRLFRVLNRTIDRFNDHLEQQGNCLTIEQQSYMEDYLLNNSGSYESKTDNYLRFETNGSGSRIIESVPITKNLGKWAVLPVEKMGFENESARVIIIVKNEVTGVKIKFLLNNKNDLRVKNTNIKIRSKYLVNSPSWNVWISRSN